MAAKIELITGTPGAGKTLLAVRRVLEEVETGRQVYCNIEGLDVPGVLPIPDEGWTACTDKSCVVIDEAQQHFPSDGRGSRSKVDAIQAMEVHRHRAIDLILITQNPRLIHSNVLALVGKHRHIERVYGSSNCRLYWQDRAMSINKTDLRDANLVYWKHPPSLYRAYHSAVEHKSGVHVPIKLIVAVVGIGLCALFLVPRVYGIATGERGLLAGPERAEGPGRETGVEREAPVQENGRLGAVPVAVGGELDYCVATRSFCRCRDRSGADVVADEKGCRLLANRGRSRVSLASGR